MSEHDRKQLNALVQAVRNDSGKDDGCKEKNYLHFFTVYFYCSYCKIHTDGRALRRSEESFRKSFNQTCFSNVCIANQDNFKQVAIVVHFAVGDVRRLKTTKICKLLKLFFFFLSAQC